MKRVHRNFLTALIVLGIGGGAAAYTWVTRIEPADELMRKQIEASRLFNFGAVDVERAVLRAKGATIAFSREGSGWQIREPVDWPADATAVDAALVRMSAARIEQDISDNATEDLLATLGLVKPSISMEVTTKDGATSTFLVGNKNQILDLYPITNAERKRVGFAEPSFVWAFDRPVDELREKRVFPFEKDSVVSGRVEKAGKLAYLLELSDRGWLVSGTPPHHQPVPADEPQIGVLVAGLTKRLKVDAFLTDTFRDTDIAARTKYGLEEPFPYVVRVGTKDGRVRTARFGSYRETSAEGGSEVVQVEGTPTVVETRGLQHEELDRDIESLRDRTLARFASSEVAHVEITLAGSKTWAVQKSDDGKDWTITSPTSLPAKVWKVEGVVRAYSFVRAVQIHAEQATPAQLREWMLEPPSRRLIFKNATGEVLAHIRLGNFATENAVFIKVDGDPRVGVVEVAKVALLPESLEDLVDDERAPKP